MAFDFFAAADDIAAVAVEHAQFVVVSADGSDHPRYAPLAGLLDRVRRGLRLDVLFVAQFIEGAPVVRQARQGTLGPQDADPVEVEYGKAVLAAASGSPEQGSHFAAPVIAKDGRRFGSVCCLAQGRRTGSRVGEQEALQSIARVLALALSRDEGASDSVWASSAAAPLGLA